MDVDDAPFKRAKKIPFQHPHEARQHNQIHLRLLQRADKRPLRLLVQLGAELPRRDESGRKISFARLGQNSSGFDIAQNQRDPGGDFSRGAGIGNGDKVRAFAGAKNAESKWIAHCNLNNRATPQDK